MKSFSQPQQRQHRVVYGCEMSPQVKQPVSARRYLPQDLVGREDSKKLVRPLDLGLRFPWLHLLSTTPSHLCCVEPLPNIRDGILVERLVKTMRYVADMRRRQYVVQRPERVRRRQRLNVEYVDRRAGDVLVRQHADQRVLLDDRPARCIDQPGRWLHSLQLRGAHQAT